LVHEYGTTNRDVEEEADGFDAELFKVLQEKINGFKRKIA